MVGHEILAGNSQIDGVPEAEFPFQEIQLVTTDRRFSGERRIFEENVVPDFVRHLIYLNTQDIWTWNTE